MLVFGGDVPDKGHQDSSFEGLQGGGRPFKGLIRPLKVLIRPFKGLIRPLRAPLKIITERGVLEAISLIF